MRLQRPVAIVIIDAPDRIEAFLPKLDELVTGGLIPLDGVDVTRYVANPRRTSKAN